MIRKAAIVAAVVLIGGAVAGWALSASATTAKKPAAAKGGGDTYLDHTVKGNFVDNGKQGFSAGDAFVFHDVLKQNGDRKGTLDGTCLFTRILGKQSGITLCTAQARVAGGQISLQVSGKNLGENNKLFKIAITGGTGSHASARGYATIKSVGENNSYITFYESR